MFEAIRSRAYDGLLDLMADVEMAALGVLGFVLLLAVPISSPVLGLSIGVLATGFLAYSGRNLLRRVRPRTPAARTEPSSGGRGVR
jgi:hypothetical protein